MAIKKGEVKRGFSNLKSNFKDDKSALRRFRDCKSCLSYYEDEDSDGEEICHDNNVTKFDMVKEDNKEYCSYWRPSWEKDL